MSRPASSSGVYGFTDAIVGTLERMRNVGRISNSDATITATRRQHGEEQPTVAPTRGASPSRRSADTARQRAALPASRFPLRRVKRRRLNHRLVVDGRATLPRHEHVPTEQQHPDDVERAADRAHPVHRHELEHRLDEIGIREATRLVERAPHEPLRDAGAVDRDDVEQDAEGRDPEVQLRELLAVELRLEEARQQPVDHAERHEAVPAERAGVHVRDDPVGVVRERVDALDREHRALERRHAVDRDRDDEELEDRLFDDLVPRAAQREQAVDHAAPRRHPEHHGEDHAERRRPLRQRRVVQVVRPGPDVDEDQRPEVQDRQPVRVDRPLGRLRHEVVHQAEERRGEEERDGVVAVPPLHERVLHAGVDRVALEGRRRAATRLLKMCRIATVTMVAM